MIFKMFLPEYDKKIISDYISREKEINTFFYGDLENYGTKNASCRFFVNRKGNQIDAIILQYRNTLFSFYSQSEDFYIEDTVNFLKDKKISVISGKERLLKKLLEYFPQMELMSTFFAKCSRKPCEKGIMEEGYYFKYLSSDEDLDKLNNLVESIEEFSFSADKDLAKEEKIAKYKSGIKNNDRYLGLFYHNDLVSTASLTAGNSISGMITSVCTSKEYRGKGLAHLTMNRLISDSLESGKKYLCLFYDNPVAGKIYHSFGFEDLDKYGMLKKKEI